MPMNEYGEIVRDSNLESSQNTNSNNTRNHGCFWWIILIILIIYSLKSCVGEIGNSSKKQESSKVSVNNFNNNSTYEQYAGPVWLTDLDYFNKNDVTIIADSTGTTNMGDSYSHYMYGKSSYGEIEYELNGNYSTLTAIWTICEMNKDTTDYNAFEIYADDSCVYKSPSLTGGDKPVMVRANINYCDKLKITFTEGTGAGELGNIKLQ